MLPIGFVELGDGRQRRTLYGPVPPPRRRQGEGPASPSLAAKRERIDDGLKVEICLEMGLLGNQMGRPV